MTDVFAFISSVKFGLSRAKLKELQESKTLGEGAEYRLYTIPELATEISANPRAFTDDMEYVAENLIETLADVSDRIREAFQSKGAA